MAIFKTGPVIASISGKLGGIVFVNTKQGKVVRKAPSHVRQRTPAQLRNRATFQASQLAWQNLTADERTQWRAAAPLYNRTNRLGVASPLSGYQFFLFVNRSANEEDVNPSVSPPQIQSSTVPTSTSLTSLSLADANWNYTPSPPPPGKHFEEYFAARSYVARSLLSLTNYKLIAVNFLVLGSGTDLRAGFEAVHGPPQLGETIILRNRNTKIGAGTAPGFLPSPVLQTHYTVVA